MPEDDGDYGGESGSGGDGIVTYDPGHYDVGTDTGTGGSTGPGSAPGSWTNPGDVVGAAGRVIAGEVSDPVGFLQRELGLFAGALGDPFAVDRDLATWLGGGGGGGGSGAAAGGGGGGGGGSAAASPARVYLVAGVIAGGVVLLAWALRKKKRGKRR